MDAEVAPGQAFADKGWDAEGDGGGNLDRLEDHAVGEGVGGGDVEAVWRTLITASWMTPMSEGIAGTTAVTLTAKEDRRGGSDASLCCRG